MLCILLSGCFKRFDELGLVSFSGSGKAQIGSNVTPLDPSSISSDVWYGKASGKYTMKRRGNATVYSQLYPFEGLLNYTSGIIHHVRIDGKKGKTSWEFDVFCNL